MNNERDNTGIHILYIVPGAVYMYSVHVHAGLHLGGGGQEQCTCMVTDCKG